MPKRRVLSEAAERAQADLRAIVVDHQRQTRDHKEKAQRILSAGPSAEARTRQLTVALLVAVAEAFSSTALRALPGASVNDTKSWPAQQKAWKMFGGVDLEKCSSYLAFRGWNEARNAIMHGMGALTEMQLTGAWAGDIIVRLDAAAVRLRKRHILIEGVDLVRCANTCYTFVAELDFARSASAGSAASS